MAVTMLKCPVTTSHLSCWYRLAPRHPWLLHHHLSIGQHCLQSQRPPQPPLSGEQTPLPHPVSLPELNSTNCTSAHIDAVFGPVCYLQSRAYQCITEHVKSTILRKHNEGSLSSGKQELLVSLSKVPPLVAFMHEITTSSSEYWVDPMVPGIVHLWAAFLIH